MATSSTDLYREDSWKENERQNEKEGVHTSPTYMYGGGVATSSTYLNGEGMATNLTKPMGNQQMHRLMGV